MIGSFIARAMALFSADCKYNAFLSDITSLFLLQGPAAHRYPEKMRSPRRILKLVGLAAVLIVALAAAGVFRPDFARAENAPDRSGEWSDWQQAKSLFEAGKYEEALHEFHSHPADSAQYFYNIGTTHLKLGQPGQAVAYLGKSNHLRAHDPDTQRNLQIAQSALGRLIGADHLDPASSGLETLADRVSMGEIRGALGLLGLIVASLWLRAYLMTRSLKRTLLQPSGFIGLIGFAITLSLYGAERLAEAHPPAYTIEHLVIRSGPGAQFAELGQLEAGIKLRLLGPEETIKVGDQQQSWKQVRYSQDGIGWIPTSSLLLF
jgi:tetratricopeptide (TPR) repeat protein